MPRLARIAPTGHLYHILTRGNNRQTVFKDEQDYETYKAILKQYKEKHAFKLYHYVLMKNHVHLVLEILEKGARLSEIMKGINLSYVLSYKKRYRHIGHFWQDRYKSILISNDAYLLACGSYVELNPVRAKIVEDPKDYPWSSYHTYAYGKKDILVDEHPLYNGLSRDPSGRRKKYRAFVRGMIQRRQAMKGEMDRRVVYGSEAFVKEMQKGYKVGAVLRPPGRPKKEEKGGK